MTIRFSNFRFLRRFFGLAIVTNFAVGGALLHQATAAEEGAAPGIKYPEYKTPKDITAYVFSRNPEIYDVELSPDGKHAAVIYSQGENLQIVIQGLEDDDEESHLRTTVQSNMFEGLYWANNEHLLLNVDKKTLVYFFNFPVNLSQPMLFSMSLRGGSVEMIWEGEVLGSWGSSSSRIVNMLRGDDEYILIQFTKKNEDYPAVFKLEVLTGLTEQVQAPRKGINNWYANDKGEVVLAMGWKKKKEIMLTRNSTEADWKEFQDSSLFEEGRFAPAYIEHDSKHLIVRSSIETGRMALYRFDMEKGQLAGKIYGHPDYDVGAVLFGKRGTQIAAVSFISDRPEYEFLNDDYKKVMAGINRAFPDRINRIQGTSYDEHYFLIFSSSDAYPGAYYRYDREAKVLKFFGEDNPAINPQMLSTTRPTTYFSADGLEIPALLTLPKDVEPKNLPLVVYPHADISDRDSVGYNYVVQFLASRGVAVLQPNYRGSTGYGYSYSMLAQGEWGGAIQDDIAQGAHAMVREGIADRERICVMGERFAGFTAIMAAAKDTQLFRCVIAMGAIIDLEDYLKRLKKAKRKDDIKLMVGERAKKEIRALSPMRAAQGIKASILYFRGEDDGVVSEEEADDFISAVRKSGTTAELVLLKDTNRIVSRPKAKLVYLREIEKFITLHLDLPQAEAVAATSSDADEEDKSKVPAEEAGF